MEFKPQITKVPEVSPVNNIEKAEVFNALAHLIVERGSLEADFANSPFINKAEDILRITLSRLKLAKEGNPIEIADVYFDVPMNDLSEKAISYYLAGEVGEISGNGPYNVEDMYISWVALDKNKHDIDGTIGSKELVHK